MPPYDVPVNPGYTPVRTRILRNASDEFVVYYRSGPHASWRRGANCATYTIAVLVAGALSDALDVLTTLD